MSGECVDNVARRWLQERGRDRRASRESMLGATGEPQDRRPRRWGPVGGGWMYLRWAYLASTPTCKARLFLARKNKTGGGTCSALRGCTGYGVKKTKSQSTEIKHTRMDDTKHVGGGKTSMVEVRPSASAWP